MLKTIDHVRVDEELWERLEAAALDGEAMTLALSNASGARIARAAAAGAISDPGAPPPEGPLPTVSVYNTEVQEGPDAVLSFPVTLNRASSATVTVDWETLDGSATAGEDYVAANGTLVFVPGETAKTVRVAVLDDARHAGAAGEAAHADAPGPGAGAGCRIADAKLLAEFHPEATEDVFSLVALADGPRPPPGVARGDLDDGPVAGRSQHRVDLGRVGLALHAQHPAHDVDALRVPASVDAEARRAADGGRVPRRCCVGDAFLDVGAGCELAGLIQRLGRREGPRAGRDRLGQGLEIAERAPLGSRVAEAAGLVAVVDAHGLLLREWRARAR